jgi:N12 class adenine-specific DNA methylase
MTAVDDSRTGGQAPAIGAVGRARASLTALETLERLRESGEPASDADRVALLGWAGWGSLANAFEPGRKGSWAEIGDRIEWLLPPADQIEARKATYSAFYTPPEITRACWQILQGLGFEGGRILEPGCGAGVFMEHTPAEIRDDVRWVGVERDPTTAAIAAALHPDARILTAPIQKAPLPVASVDAVLGNVPFADHLVYDPGAPEPVRASLHNYCLWRSIQTLRPGGIAVLITSRYTLDAKDPSARQHLFAQTDLLDAIRLPSTVWQPGGTKVTADILVLRRRRGDEDVRTHDRTWLDTQEVPQLETPVNRLLLTRPELVVGTMRAQHGHRYGHTLSVEFTPTETVPTWQQGMAQAVAAVTAERPDQPFRLWHVDAPIQVINAGTTALSDAEGRPEGSFHIVDGRAMVVVDGQLAAVQTRRTRKADAPTNAPTNVQTDTADANTDGAGTDELNSEHADDGDLADADTGSASAEDGTADKYEYFDLSGKQLGELSALIELRDAAVAVQEHELRALEQERIAQRAEQRLAVAHRQLINAHAAHLTALTTLTGTRDGQLVTPGPLVRAAILASAQRAAATARQVPEEQQQAGAERDVAQQQVTRVDGELEPMRERLNTLYDAYQARYGFLNRVKISSGKPDEETGLPTITKRRPPIMQDALHAVGEGTEPVTVRFRTDPNYFDLLALEDWDADNQVARKHKIFTTRVNKAAQRITRADSAADAIALCLDAHNKLDLPTIAALLDVTVEQVPEALGELAYFDPATREWTERGEYLSGDVRMKLDRALAAAEQDPQRFTRNVDALHARQPRDLGPGEIYGQLGAAWIPETDVAQFIRELLRPRGQVAVQREPLTSTWSLTLANKADRSRPEASHEWGTDAKDAYSLIELELNGSVAEVTKTIKEKGKKETIVDRDATAQAKAKQKQIATRFSEWLWEDPERADRLAEKYNRSFNATVLRDYDGSHLTVPGMAADFVPYASQRDMVFRAISNKTALCGHAVGGGKTTIMAMTAVKLRQLGLANKPMIVVLKATLEDIAREIKQRVPAANLLVADEHSMSDWRSRALWAKRCATGDYDAVIITHPAFTKISMHEQFQADYLAELAASYRASLNASMGSVDAEDNETGPSDRRVKQVEKLISALEARAEYLLEHASDEGIYFEQLGVDYLLVDEFHYFKNLQVPCHTEGFSMSASKRATDLDMKLSWLRTQRDRVATFFSGTPVSNSMLELYVVLHYMMPERLEELGMSSPDAWARWCVLFEEVLEISPDGQTPRTKRRPNRFKNVYELLMLLTERADIRSKKQLGLLLPPTTRATEVVPRSRVQEAYIAELAARAEAVKGKPPRPGEDNILKVATDGRKGAIDPALVELFDPAAVKFDQAIDNIVATYRATRDLQFPADAKHEADAVTGQRGGFQLAFCDLGTPGDKNKKKTTSATGRNPVHVYAKIRDGLVAEGIPRERIRFIHDAKSDQQRAQLFAACRTGEVSVLIASTEKGGVGVNVQDRMVRMHHVDAPWRPSDIEQREGRGERPGNRMRALADLIAQMEERGEAVPENWPRTVEITTYVSEGTFDSFMWGKLEYKAGFIGQLLGSKLDPGLREIEDVGTVTMNYAEVKALAAGNEQLMDLAKAEQQLKALQDLAAAHTRTQRRLDTEITRYQKTASTNDATIRALDAITAALGACEDDQRGFFTGSGDPAAGPIPEDDLDTVLVGVAQQAVTARNDAKARRSAAEVQRGVEPVGKSTDVLRWQSMGLTFEVRATGWRKDTLYALVRPNGLRSTVDQHRLELNLTYLNKGQHFRIRQALDKFLTICADQASDLRANTAELRDRLEAGRRQVGKPFPQLVELEAARTEVERLKTELESVKAQVDSESGGHNQGAGANQHILQLARDAYFDPARRRQLVEVLTATSAPGTVIEVPPRPRLAPAPGEPSASPADDTHLPPATSLTGANAGKPAPASPNRGRLIPSDGADAGVSSVDRPREPVAARREPGATIVLPDTTALSETRAPDHASRTWTGTHASGVDILITRHTIDPTANPAALASDPAGSSTGTVWTYRLSRRTPDRAFVIGEPWTPQERWATATELLDHLQRHVTAYTLPRALLPFLIAAASQDVEDLRAIPDQADPATPLLTSAVGGQTIATSVEEAAAYLVRVAKNTDDYRRPLVWRGVDIWFEVLPTNPAYPTDLTGLVAVVGTAYRNPIPTDWLTERDNRIVALLDDILTHTDQLRDAHETYLAALTALAAEPAQPIHTLPDRPTPATVLKPTNQPAQQPPPPTPATTTPPVRPLPAPGDTSQPAPPAPAAVPAEPVNAPSIPRPRHGTPTEPARDGDAPDEPTDRADSADEVDGIDEVGAAEARAVLDTLATTDITGQWWELSEELRFAGYRHVRADEVGLGGVDHDERSVRTDAGWQLADELVALARHVADVRERHNRSAAAEVADTVLATPSSTDPSAGSSMRTDRRDLLRALVAGGVRGRAAQWVADQLHTVAAMRAVARAADEQPATTILSPHGTALTHDVDFSRRANRDETPLSYGGIQITLLASPARLEAAIEAARNSPGPYWVPLPDSTSTERTTIRDQLLDAIATAARVAGEHYTNVVREIARHLPIQRPAAPHTDRDAAPRDTDDRPRGIDEREIDEQAISGELREALHAVREEMLAELAAASVAYRRARGVGISGQWNTATRQVLTDPDLPLPVEMRSLGGLVDQVRAHRHELSEHAQRAHRRPGAGTEQTATLLARASQLDILARAAATCPPHEHGYRIPGPGVSTQLSDGQIERALQGFALAARRGVSPADVLAGTEIVVLSNHITFRSITIAFNRTTDNDYDGDYDGSTEGVSEGVRAVLTTAGAADGATVPIDPDWLYHEHGGARIRDAIVHAIASAGAHADAARRHVLAVLEPTHDLAALPPSPAEAADRTHSTAGADRENRADPESRVAGVPQPDPPAPSDGVADAPTPGESRAEIAGERVLTLHFSEEHGVLLLGTDQTDDLGPLLKQQRAGWKHSHRITGPHGETGAWYLPKTRQQNRQGTKLRDFHRRIDDRLTKAGQALVQRGFTLRLDLHDLPEQTIRTLQDWRRSVQPTAEETSQHAAVTGRVAGAMDRTRARIGYLASQVPDPVLTQAWTDFAGEFLIHGIRPDALAARRQVLVATLPDAGSPADEHMLRAVRAVLAEEGAASAVPDGLRDQFRAEGVTEEDVADVVGGIAGYATALLDRISDTDEIGRYLAATDAVAVVDVLGHIANTVADLYQIERPENFPPRSVITAITQPPYAPMTSQEITAITGLPYWLVRSATPAEGAADALARQNRVLWGHSAAEAAVLRQLQLGLISVDQAGEVLRRSRSGDSSVFGQDRVRLQVRIGEIAGEITERQVDLSGHVVLRGTTSDGEPLVVRADPRTRWDPNTTVLNPPPDRPLHLIHRGTDRLITDLDATTTTVPDTATSPVLGAGTDSVDAATESAPAAGEVVDAHGVTAEHPVVGYVRESVARLPHDPNPERAVADRYRIAAGAIDLYVVNPQGSGVGWVLRTIGRHDGTAESVIPRSVELRPPVEWPHWIRSLRQSTTILRAAGGLDGLADRVAGVADLLARRTDALATTLAAFQVQTGAAGVRLLPADHPAAPALVRQLDRARHSQRVTGERHDTQLPLKLAIEVLDESDLSADELAERACYGTSHSLLRWWPTVTELRDLADVVEAAGYTTPLPGREVSAPELWRAVADGVAARLTDRPRHEPDVPVEVPEMVPTEPRARYAGEKTTPVDQLLDKITNGTAHREDAEHTRMAASTATDVAQPMLADLDAADPDRVQRAAAALQQGARDEALLHLSWAVDGRRPVGRRGVREAWDVLYQLLWPEPGWNLERVARRMITWADHDPAQLAGALVALATAWRTRAETGDDLARLLSEPPVAAIADQLETVAGYLATHWQFTKPALPRIRAEQASLFDLAPAVETATEKKPRTRTRPTTNTGTTRPDPEHTPIAPAATSQEHTPPVSDTPRTGSDAAPPSLAGEPTQQASQRTRDATPTTAVSDTTPDTTPDVVVGAVGETASGAPTLRGLRAIAAAHDLHVRVVRVADAAFVTVHEPAAPTPPVLSWPVGATEVFDGAGRPMPAEHAGEYLARYRSAVEPELVAAVTGVEDWARRVAYLTPHLVPEQPTPQQSMIRYLLTKAVSLAGEDRTEAENELRRAEDLAGPPPLTPEREAQIVREIHDHASGYAWAGDVGRYLTAPGHLDGSWQEWDWINTYVRDHPEVLAGHPDHKRIQARTKAELAAQKQAGDDLRREALSAHRAGRFEQALDLLDQAELANPADAARLARARARVHDVQKRTPTPASPTAPDQSTPNPVAGPAEHAERTAASEAPDTAANRQIRTEPHQTEPVPTSPHETDTAPAEPTIGIEPFSAVEVSRERGAEVFEAAVAEAHLALAETAAAGGHKPTAWVRFAPLTHTDPRTGISYSATQPEHQVVSQWWVQQATAAFGELGYRVESRHADGRRKYRDHQIEVDHAAKLVIVDAAQPVGTNAFNLVHQVAALRTELHDTTAPGQTATLDNAAQAVTDTSGHSGHSATPAPTSETRGAAREPAGGVDTPPSGATGPTPTDSRPAPATTPEPDPPAEPGVWSQRIQVNLSPTDLTVSGTDRGRDPDSIRATLKSNSFWWQKPVWRYKGRASGRDTAAQAIRDLLTELDAQAQAASAAPSHPPTPQQQEIKDAVAAGHDVAVFALAGTGKTTTLRMLAHALPDLRIVYIAFNRSIADEAQASFPSHVDANTMHSFAKQALQGGPHGALLDKLDKGVRLPKDIAPVLGITAPFRDGVTEFSPEALARLAMATVAQFRNSAADNIGPAHLPAGIAENQALARMVLGHANQVWTDILSPTGRIVFTHDDYLKIWALTKPRFTADVIFFDEAQDINDVQKQVILDHRAARDGHRATQIIVVGDSYQSIYGFRGAKDALRSWPVDVRLPLTQSWRFGPAIADLGNRFLALLKASMRLEGNPALDTRLEPVPQPDAVLCRTNAGAVTAVFEAHEAGHRVALVGGGDAIRDIAKAALALQRGRRTRHPELSGFADWSEVREAASEEQAVKHLQPFVRLVDRHGAHALIDMADALVSETDPNPDTGPQLVVSTVHKAKGREWDAVRIAGDFRGPTVDDDGNTVLPGAEELRLSYVTVTRAKKTLELGSLSWILDYPSSPAAPGSQQAHASLRVGGADQAVDEALVEAEPELSPTALQTPTPADQPVVEPSPGPVGDRTTGSHTDSDVQPASEQARHEDQTGRPTVLTGPSAPLDGVEPDSDAAISALDHRNDDPMGRGGNDATDTVDPTDTADTDGPSSVDSDGLTIDERYAAEGYPLIEGLTGVSELFRAHHWDLVEVQPVEDVGTYTEHWRRRDVSVAVSITPEDRVLTRLFIRHGPWDSDAWHEVETESAQYVRDLAEQAGLRGLARPARLPGLWRVEAFTFAADATSAHADNADWRLVARPAGSAADGANEDVNGHVDRDVDGDDAAGWVFDDGTSVPLAPPLPRVAVSTRDDVIKYVLGDRHRDKDLRRTVQVVVSGRANKGLYMADAQRQLAAAEPEIYRRALTAAVGRPRKRGEQFDVGRAQQALERLVEGDPTLPLNSIGQYIEIAEPDPEAESVPLVGPGPTRTVRGVVVEVTPHAVNRLSVVIERDVTSVTGAPRASQDVPVDAVLPWLDPALRPSAEELRTAREAMVPAIREREQQLGLHTIAEPAAVRAPDPIDIARPETSPLPVEQTDLIAGSRPAASGSSSDAVPDRDATASVTPSGPDPATDTNASPVDEAAVPARPVGSPDTGTGSGQTEDTVDTGTADNPGGDPGNDMAAAALAWWDFGCSVLRVETDGSKRPLPHQWAPYQQQRATREEVATWFQNGHPGVGIVTGAVSGDLEMLEFEGRAINEGLVEQLRSRLNDLGHPNLWGWVTSGYQEMSPSGGIHVLYRVQGGADRNTRLAQREARDDELTDDEQREFRKSGRRARRVLIETRGEGGFVVVAPSHGPVHDSGRPWETLSGKPWTILTITAAERDALHMAARDLDQVPAPPPIPEPAPRRAQDEGLRPGEDFNLRASWHQVLESHGWVAVGGDSARTFWRRPGKNHGVSAVTGGDRGDYLWVFSTSTALPSEQALSKWRTYGLLDHAGDFRAAAQALAAAGYGDQTRPAPAGRRPAVDDRARPDRSRTADDRQLNRSAREASDTLPPSANTASRSPSDQLRSAGGAASSPASGREPVVPQVQATVAPPAPGDADTITRQVGVHTRADVTSILRDYHNGRQSGWLPLTSLIDDIGIGHRLHIATQSLAQVREATRRLWPVATDYGLGLDVALDPDTLTDTAGAGVIVHLPRLDTLDRDTSAVVAALKGFRAHPDPIPGTTPIADAVSHHHSRPSAPAEPPEGRAEAGHTPVPNSPATTAAGTVDLATADGSTEGTPHGEDGLFAVAASRAAHMLDRVDPTTIETATRLIKQADREGAMQALWAGIPIVDARLTLPVIEIVRDVVYGVAWGEHLDPDHRARVAIAAGHGLPTAINLAAVAQELYRRTNGDDPLATLLQQTGTTEIVTQLYGVVDRMAVHGEFVVPSRPNLLSRQESLFDLSEPDTETSGLIAPATQPSPSTVTPRDVSGPDPASVISATDEPKTRGSRPPAPVVPEGAASGSGNLAEASHAMANGGGIDQDYVPPLLVESANATGEVVPLPAGEVLVKFAYGPAFPGVLTEPGPLSTVDDHMPTGRFPTVGVRFRRSVAEWIGLYSEAQYGGNQIRYEWRDDVLAIYDDPWDENPDDQPRLVHPDSEGRYLLPEPWLAPTTTQTLELARHVDALAILAGNKPVQDSEAMARYFADGPGRDHVYDAVRELIRERTEAGDRASDEAVTDTTRTDVPAPDVDRPATAPEPTSAEHQQPDAIPADPDPRSGRSGVPGAEVTAPQGPPRGNSSETTDPNPALAQHSELSDTPAPEPSAVVDNEGAASPSPATSSARSPSSSPSAAAVALSPAVVGLRTRLAGSRVGWPHQLDAFITTTDPFTAQDLLRKIARATDNDPHTQTLVAIAWRAHHGQATDTEVMAFADRLIEGDPSTIGHAVGRTIRDPRTRQLRTVHAIRADIEGRVILHGTVADSTTTLTTPVAPDAWLNPTGHEILPAAETFPLLERWNQLCALADTYGYTVHDQPDTALVLHDERRIVIGSDSLTELVDQLTDLTEQIVALRGPTRSTAAAASIPAVDARVPVAPAASPVAAAREAQPPAPRPRRSSRGPETTPRREGQSPRRDAIDGITLVPADDPATEPLVDQLAMRRHSGALLLDEPARLAFTYVHRILRGPAEDAGDLAHTVLNVGHRGEAEQVAARLTKLADKIDQAGFTTPITGGAIPLTDHLRAIAHHILARLTPSGTTPPASGVSTTRATDTASTAPAGDRASAGQDNAGEPDTASTATPSADSAPPAPAASQPTGTGHDAPNGPVGTTMTPRGDDREIRTNTESRATTREKTGRDGVPVERPVTDQDNDSPTPSVDLRSEPPRTNRAPATAAPARTDSAPGRRPTTSPTGNIRWPTVDPDPPRPRHPADEPPQKPAPGQPYGHSTASDEPALASDTTQLNRNNGTTSGMVPVGPDQDSATAQWVRLVDQASRAGYAVVTAYDTSSAVDDANRVIRIDGNQEPLARVVDLAHKIGLIDATVSGTAAPVHERAPAVTAGARAIPRPPDQHQSATQRSGANPPGPRRVAAIPATHPSPPLPPSMTPVFDTLVRELGWKPTTPDSEDSTQRAVASRPAEPRPEPSHTPVFDQLMRELGWQHHLTTPDGATSGDQVVNPVNRAPAPTHNGTTNGTSARPSGGTGNGPLDGHRPVATPARPRAHDEPAMTAGMTPGHRAHPAGGWGLETAGTTVGTTRGRNGR